MNKTQEALKLALEQRITDYLSGGGLFNPELADHIAVRDLLIDCRKALAEHIGDANKMVEQPAQQQEPVATVTSESGNPNVSMSWWHEPALPVGTKLYTSPQPSKPWVGLTDEEIEIINDCGDTDSYKFARAIEAKLKEKNK